MPTDVAANDLCLKCQLCCQGIICRIVVSEEEKALFPTIDFSNNRQSDGRSFINQPCPHIDADGCQVYSNRPKDCSSFECRLLKKLKKGGVTFAAATQTIEDLKEDIGKLADDLREGEQDHRGFRELYKQWIENGLHQKNQILYQRLRTVLKQVNKQFLPQSTLKQLPDIAPTNTKRISGLVQNKPNATMFAVQQKAMPNRTKWNQVASRMQVISRRQVVQSLLLETEDIHTPAYVVDGRSLDQIVANARSITDKCGAKLLYSVKANAVAAVIERLAPQVDGFQERGKCDTCSPWRMKLSFICQIRQSALQNGAKNFTLFWANLFWRQP